MHSGTRNAQRGSKAQPGGMACSGGTVPSMVSKGSARFGFKIGHGLQKAAGIGMCGGRERFHACSELDYAAGIHDGDAVGDLRDHGEIVRDEEHGEAEF